MRYMKRLIQNEYNLEIKNIYRKKSYYICNTNKGIYRFKQTYSTPKEIYFKTDIKKHLLQNGFENLDHIYMTKRKTPFVRQDYKYYILTKYFANDKLDFSNELDFINVIKNIGLLHKNLNNIKFSGYVHIGATNPIKQIDEDIEFFYAINSIVKKKTPYSDFDVCFLKTFEKNMQTMEKCRNDFKKLDINSIINSNISDKTVCHGLLKESNILINNKDVIFENFSRCSVEPQIYDLSYFIKRYIKSLPEINLNINKIIDIYMEENSLMNKKELLLLNSILKYPVDYIKLYKEYYEKNRSWTPNKFTNKLTELMNNQETYENYIDELYFD